MEIVAEATTEQRNEDAAKKDPASADGALLPTSAEAVAALVLLCRRCDEIEGTGLSLVECLDYIGDAVIKQAVATMKQATLLQYFKSKEYILCSIFKCVFSAPQLVCWLISTSASRI